MDKPRRPVSSGQGERYNPECQKVKEGDECQQAAVDAALRDCFADLARPTLSLSFNRKLRSSLAVERRRQAQARQRVRLLRGYWLVAGLVCAVILARLPWSELPLSEAWLAMVALALSAVLPVWLILHACSIDPIDLVLATIDTLIDPADQQPGRHGAFRPGL